MANKIYPKWKEALLQASSDSALTGTVKVALVDLGTYTDYEIFPECRIMGMLIA